MIKMQTKMLAAIEQVIARQGPTVGDPDRPQMEPTVHAIFGNTGRVYAMEGFATTVEVKYEFDDASCSLRFEGPLISEAIDAGVVTDRPGHYRVHIEPDRWDYPMLKYNDGAEIEDMLRLLDKILSGVGWGTDVDRPAHSVPATS